MITFNRTATRDEDVHSVLVDLFVKICRVFASSKDKSWRSFVIHYDFQVGGLTVDSIVLYGPETGKEYSIGVDIVEWAYATKVFPKIENATVEDLDNFTRLHNELTARVINSLLAAARTEDGQAAIATLRRVRPVTFLFCADADNWASAIVLPI